MKPANFPGRKLARRTGALARFAKRKNKDATELARLTFLCRQTPEQARAIRTKKYRA